MNKVKSKYVVLGYTRREQRKEQVLEDRVEPSKNFKFDRMGSFVCLQTIKSEKREESEVMKGMKK